MALTESPNNFTNSSTSPQTAPLTTTIATSPLPPSKQPQSPTSSTIPHKKGKSNQLRRWPLAVACGLAIMVSLMTYSILQERIMTRPYTSFNIDSLTLLKRNESIHDAYNLLNHSDTSLNKARILDTLEAERNERIRIEKPAFFHNSLFLVLANRLFAAAIAAAAIILRRSKSDLSSRAHLGEYAVVSLSNVIATSCQYEALKWLTFPTVTIGKCAKMLPVMLILNWRAGRKYSLDDYGVVAVVLAGCAVMISSGNVVAKRAASADTDTPVGFVLLIVYLFFDALTSTYQERLFSKYDMSVYNQMLFINVTSATISMAGLAVSGGLRRSLLFLIAYPAILRDITMLSLSAVAGQFAITFTIQTFGALLYSGIMTTRQLFSVLLSEIIFKHGLTAMQWVGALMVFAALFYKVFRKAIQNNKL